MKIKLKHFQEPENRGKIADGEAPAIFKPTVNKKGGCTSSHSVIALSSSGGFYLHIPHEPFNSSGLPSSLVRLRNAFTDINMHKKGGIKNHV
jgi:hypothetical protein